MIGLQTAVSLLETGDYDVTIVAKHYPGDKSIEYTSPWAGAQWRTHASPDDEEQKAWDISSYKKWWKIVKGEAKHGAKSGLGVSFEFLHVPSALTDVSTPDLRFDILQVRNATHAQ